ncbi:MAG TPA: hypothetical protein VFG83_15585 [Kofleriaceae bacterium]|nr:hypothetical protein [Kofleriaceae bacterium]
MKNKIVLVAAVCLLSGIAARQAAADRRVVVLDFQGKGARGIHNQVTRIVAQRHQALSGRRYDQTARKMNARKQSARNVRRVCGRLGADGVVSGQIRRQHRRYVLKLSLRSGKTGAVAKTLTVNLGRRPRISGASKRRIRRDLLPAIQHLPALGHRQRQAQNDREEPAGDDVDEVLAGDRDNDEANDSDDDGDSDEADDSGDSDGDEDDDTAASLTDSEAADLAVRGRAVELSGGLSFIGRNLTFTAADGLMDPPQAYEGSLVPGIRAEVEIYPLAFTGPSPSFSHNLGISAVVNKVVKIESHISGMNDVTLPTSQSRYGVGLVYRQNFGDSATSPTLKASVRINKRSFTIDTTDSPVTIDIPDVSYTYLDPGLSLRYPIVAKLAAIAEARLLLITATGEIQETTSYGSASLLGLDLAVALEYKLTGSLAARAGGRYASISYDFSGDGDLSNNRDGDPMSVDVSGARDRYMGLFVGLGYAF